MLASSDDAVDSALEMEKRRLTEYVEVEGRDKTAKTDVVSVKVNGKVGKDKLKDQAWSVDLGDDSNNGLWGFAERLLDIPLDAKSLEVSYDIDDAAVESGAPEALKGQAVNLNVEVVEVRERKVPELNDDFAKDTGKSRRPGRVEGQAA